ncbi:MAG: hypothetical protein IJL26_10250 [Clostridia bacterium]|nr:hypothetical protein [Clostridia bacterium]
MEKIGKALLAEMGGKFADIILNRCNQSIDKFMPDASAEEKEKRAYRSLYNYWVYGNNTDEDFYLDFDNKSHEEKCEYMTFRKKTIYLYHINNPAKKHMFEDKYEAYTMFKEHYHREVIRVNGPEDYDVFRDFVSRHKSFVVKPCGLAFAIGVYRVDITDMSDIEKVFNDMLENGKKHKEENWWGRTTAVVVEELIPQHEKLASIHPDSVNGIRLPTVRVNGKVHFYHPWIKTGVSGDFIASATFGGLDVGIDPATGIIRTQGFNEAGEAFSSHPTTGVPFIGFQIPMWDSLLELAEKLALSLPEDVNYIGWDFALTPDGWCIMEGNFEGDFMWQVFEQKGNLKEFEELIGWKFDKEFWWQKK